MRRLADPRAGARFARASRCASRHQCFLTLNQMSAACTMLRMSASAIAGGTAGCERGSNRLIQCRVAGFVGQVRARAAA